MEYEIIALALGAWIIPGLILLGLVRPHNFTADVVLVLLWPAHVWQHFNPKK